MFWNTKVTTWSDTNNPKITQWIGQDYFHMIFFFSSSWLEGKAESRQKPVGKAFSTRGCILFFFFTEYYFRTVESWPITNPQIKAAIFLWLLWAIAYSVSTQLHVFQRVHTPMLPSLFTTIRELLYSHHNTKIKTWIKSNYHPLFS